MSEYHHHTDTNDFRYEIDKIKGELQVQNWPNTIIKMYMLYKVIWKKLKTLKFVVETYVGPFSKRITNYKGLEWLDFTECSATEKCQNDPGPKRRTIWT